MKASVNSLTTLTNILPLFYFQLSPKTNIHTHTLTHMHKPGQFFGEIIIRTSNEIGSFVETWMHLETVIQSEVSQKEKNKYHILTHICGI